MDSNNKNTQNSRTGEFANGKFYSRPSAQQRQELEKMPESARPFSKTNILMMLGCVALIVIGFALMSGGGSSVEGGFNPDIFSTRRIVVGPTIAFLGFLLMAFAIIYTPSSRRNKKVS